MRDALKKSLSLNRYACIQYLNAYHDSCYNRKVYCTHSTNAYKLFNQYIFRIRIMSMHIKLFLANQNNTISAKAEAPSLLTLPFKKFITFPHFPASNG